MEGLEASVLENGGNRDGCNLGGGRHTPTWTDDMPAHVLLFAGLRTGAAALDIWREATGAGIDVWHRRGTAIKSYYNVTAIGTADCWTY